ncbi:hypothetical protein [Heyndrickxia camelliae]|uniref:TRASH domain-containing protein n=1 Tax=Heyndrickxia camelliae TaxID=1707093 RepID=A0A2N3LDF6_9BACI|nr:hypothetical protein [Heyndrickxia camelliae]PKR82605.1 hypothetical protein CWO92_23525 [Heyndrickxia camelliae]
MIVEGQKVQARWHHSNKDWYIVKGYHFTKLGEFFTVRVEDLQENSKVEISVICDFCSSHYNLKNSIAVSREHHFCDRNCYNSYRRINGSPNNTRVKLDCFNCGKEIEVKKYRYDAVLNGEQEFITCSRQCQNELIGKNNRGKNNRNYKGNVKKTCEVCGEGFEVAQNRKDKARFCSKECQIKFLNSEPVNHVRWVSFNKNKTNTKPQRIVNEMLEQLNIAYENEHICTYYAIDNYLSSHNLMIEVMGDYWHSSHLRFPNISEFKEMNFKNMKKDKQKHTFIRNQYGVEILYLWESDIVNNAELVISLIKEYVSSNGKLRDYHSFNYTLIKNKLMLNNDVIVPYFLRKHSELKIS